MEIKQIISQEHKSIIIKQEGKAKMILAYHTLGNGTCFGGVRILPHGSAEAAIKDALRLSEAMTYKLACIDEPYGGCKAVVLMPKDGKTNEFLRQIGKLVEDEKGKFISAIDFGFEPDDAKIIRETTQHILAIKDSEFGQSGVTTALGVVKGIQETLKQTYGSEEIKGKSFAVQGLGSVGNTLAKELIKHGGKVYVSDTDKMKTGEFKGIASIVPTSKILYLHVDVLCPCGPAYVINKSTIPKLNCRIIAGGANCQLEDEVNDDEQLRKRGILAAPDYVINAGGVMQGIEELKGGSLEKARKRLQMIQKNLAEIYSLSSRKKKGTYAVAKEMALLKKSRMFPG